MASPAHLRVHGPSRGAVALATAALVAVTSGATALIVLSTTGGVGSTSPTLTPLPPVLAAPGGPPVVVLPPGALGTALPSVVAPSRTGTTSVSTSADGSVSGSTDSAATRSVRLAGPVVGGAPGVRPLEPGQPTGEPGAGPAPALPLERPVTSPLRPAPVADGGGDDLELLERDRERRARGGSKPLAQPVVDVDTRDLDTRDLDTEADRFDLSRDDDEPVVAVPLSADPDADGPATGHAPGIPKSRAVPATPGSAAGPAVPATPPSQTKKAAAAVKKAAPGKKAAPVQKAVPEKAAPVKKAAAEKKAAPVKKAAAEKKAAPVKKAAPEKKAAPAKKPTSAGKGDAGDVKARGAAPGKASRSRSHSR